MKSVSRFILLSIILIPLICSAQQSSFVAELEPAWGTLTNLNQPNVEDYILVYPSPFSDVCIIKISTPENQNISVDIYNSSGVRVKSLVNNEYIESPLSIVWSGSDDKGNTCPDGIYFIKLSLSEKTFTQQVIKKKSGN